MTELLQIVSVETMSDKDGIEYKRITLKNGEQGFIQLPNGQYKEIKQLSRTTIINAWPAHERNGMTFRADEAHSLVEGDETPGKIVTLEVPVYEIVDTVSGDVREASRYTTAVFGDSSDVESFKAATKATFKRNGHDLDAAKGVVAPKPVQPIVNEEVKKNAEIA